MINYENLSPEEAKRIIKDFSHMKFERTPQDFHVYGSENLIDSAEQLDDHREFELDMFDRGNASDLPDSDLAQNCRTQGINQKTCFDKRQ